MRHMESFGEQLRALREERKLTVNQLATYSGVSAAGIEETFSITEQSAHSMDQVLQNAEELERLAKELNAKMEQFTI